MCNISSVRIGMTLDAAKCQWQVRFGHFPFDETPQAQLVDPKPEDLNFSFGTCGLIYRLQNPFKFEPCFEQLSTKLIYICGV